MNSKHCWFFFFDEKPDQGVLVASTRKELADADKSREIAKPPARVLLSFSVSSQIGESFTKWLTGSGGGCKKDRGAQQTVKRCFKFLKFCCEDEGELSFEVLDFSLCSHSLLLKFIDHLQDECKLGQGGRLGYIEDIFEMIDFRRRNGASDTILRNLSSTELYLKRTCKTVAKMMRLQWTQDLDIETLDARGHWLDNHGRTVRSGDFSFASLRKHHEDVSSQPLRLNICHEICGDVFVHQGEAISPYDLSVLDSRSTRLEQPRRTGDLLT